MRYCSRTVIVGGDMEEMTGVASEQHGVDAWGTTLEGWEMGAKHGPGTSALFSSLARSIALSPLSTSALADVLSGSVCPAQSSDKARRSEEVCLGRWGWLP